ncbi:MAG: 8-oxo-dGTP diphosphatase [Gemmatimonadales bacterium]|nr:8-oxo-dGTP diphosphatase [Gemmatimonadales bacterium]MYG48324.1 8-oxo-dGTP diphosphatase [Gemmatimonadales bacterium]MYK01578.1 8-oxo-dGTP diphosphatase [Candidatus Palauibacter ramosifaciens]
MRSRSPAMERPIPESWRPDLHATLLFIVRGGEILLIHKKRGLGAGKLNGAGGKVEPGESTLDAAMREFQEELRARPVTPRKVGEVAFEVLSGMSILIHVFRSDALEGEPVETSEATPRWTPVDDIPYDRMWEDDRHWLPHVIDDRPFEAYARFEGDDMVHCRVVLLPGTERVPWKSR